MKADFEKVILAQFFFGAHTFLLLQDLLRGLVDPDIKPDRVQRDRLAAIIASPSHHLSREEKGRKTCLWNARWIAKWHDEFQ